MQTRKSFILALVLLFFLVFPSFSDERTENIDIILALDKSLSMAEDQKIDGVKKYVDTWLLDQVLIPGDNLIIVAFYGKTDVIVSQRVQNNADILKIKQIISQIRANGRFTDIGNALDALKVQLEKLTNDGRKKFVLMMTDGKQEAPPTSKYYSPDGKFNHEFLANTKTIQQTGWKIQILGIGTEAEAKQLAEQLSGSYTELTGDLSVETLKAQTQNLLGSVSLIGAVPEARVGGGGRSALALTLKSEGYSQELRVGVAEIMARIPAHDSMNILGSPYTIKVPASGTVTVRIPVRFPADLPQGKTDGALSFTFLAGERFNPSDVSVSLFVQGTVENYWWVGVVGIVALALLVLAVVLLIRRFTTGKGVRFRILIDDEPIRSEASSLRPGGELFLNEIEGAFQLISRRNARSMARFRLKERALGFDILKAERFPKQTGSAEGIIGESFVVHGENGKNRKLRVESGEPKKAAPRPVTMVAEEKGMPERRRPRTRAAVKSRPATRPPKTAKASRKPGAARRKRGR
jgi:Mg-chelatase subunit ChlD